ncbi:aldo/keto reductase [Opitutaceae bacterium TAV4]|nr:aldo/keto reductase [Opitutaceae bacterium TAV4]RRJ99645.1 aldo/keto reductase [Opitutaceae bacterium TAV3]
MKQRKLGRTELYVSELCLGTLSFGWTTPETTSHAILDAFRAAGGNFIQGTSLGPDLESSAAPANPAEEHVGRWLQSRRIPRHELIIGTRIALRRHQRGPEYIARTLHRCCETAISRLHCQHLDLVLIEWHESLPPTDDILAAIDRLKLAGLVRCVGASGFPTWRIMESLGRAARLNTNRFEVAQSDYSLLDHTRYEEDTLDLCQEHRLGFLARSPLAGGYLINPLAPTHTARSQWLRARYASVHTDATLATLQDIATTRQAPPSQIALAWVLANPRVTAPVLGVTALEHLQSALDATRLQLTEDDMQRLTAGSAEIHKTAAP